MPAYFYPLLGLRTAPAHFFSFLFHSDPVASAVLFRYAEVILRSKLSQTKSGMGQAARMLRRASDLDPGAQNLKLQLLASILGLSQITSKRGGNVAVAAAERLGPPLPLPPIPYACMQAPLLP